MNKERKHLRADQFSTTHVYKSKRTGRGSDIPFNDRASHGGKILRGYSKALADHDGKKGDVEIIADDSGVYVELTSVKGVSFPIDSLDSVGGYKLQSLHVNDNDQEVAVLFIPDDKRHLFDAKIRRYLDPEKDRSGKPVNHNLIDSIDAIRLADIRSFWTDDKERLPQDSDQTIWMELWLSDRNADAQEQIEALSERFGLPLQQTRLRFHQTLVVLIYASLNQLEVATELISCLEELRLAKETPQVFTTMSPREQKDWADEILSRVKFDDAGVSIAILDTGVNYNNPLLSVAAHADWCKSWDDTWPAYTDDPRQLFHSHGSLQAGVSLYGNLLDVAGHGDSVEIKYRIESGRILPPAGDNPPELYGAITTQTAQLLQGLDTTRRRVFSLAVTSDPEKIGGQPSSWSAEIDEFTYNCDHGAQLFVISAGNNRELDPSLSSWDQAHLSQIEDPAQAWNALTVGGSTELTTNDDALLEGWEPWCQGGDLAPASRTSVNWGWVKQSPYKPDVVAEAGNRLISPEQSELTDADCVSILTTSGKAAGALFDTTRDTSAATALISNYAAVLMTEYPEYWAETIRALLVHSAEWTPRMLERKAELEKQHAKTKAAGVLIRSFGFGVPSLIRARFSADHALTLIAQGEMNPFSEGANGDVKLGDMHYYNLPWPIEALRELDPATPVQLKVTLSYFIEPNPGRRGYRNRFSYQSHGLRFEVSRPGQTEENFQGVINKLLEAEDYEGPEGDLDGWRFGSNMRTRGSIHSDVWEGNAASLIDMNKIAVVPVSGWWKFRKKDQKWRQRVRYSLVVSIVVPNVDLDVDIYSPVEQLINLAVEAQAKAAIEI
jgi:hypothetical protein